MMKKVLSLFLVLLLLLTITSCGKEEKSCYSFKTDDRTVYFGGNAYCTYRS